MRRFNKTTSIPLFTTAALTLCPIVAHASGFALLEQSASRLGMAFAGTAVAADDATTVFFNPAGLNHLQGPEAIVVASGIEITSQFGDEGSQPALAQPLGHNGGDAGGWNFVPSAYVAAPVSDTFAIGVGVNAPFGLKTDYGPGWIGRFQALKSEIRTINLNPSIAWRVNETLSLGVGVNYQRLEAELTNAVSYSAVVAQGVQQLVALGQLPPAAAPGVIAANAGLEGRARVSGDDKAWGFNLGLLLDVSETTRIGIAYRSKIDYEVSGSVNFAPPAIAHPVGAAIVASASASGAPLATGPASVDLELPEIATVSLRRQFGERVALFADVGWTGWSSVQELRVVRDTGAVVSVTPEEWEDTFRYALGGAYEMSDALTVRAGVAYDESAVPDSIRTPRLPDTNRTWVAFGARWQPTESILLDLGYAHLFSDTVPLNQNAGNIASSAFLIGEQESDIDIVSTQFTYRF
ncbi:MAG: OmpP1/FadL family transporter [Steroidobacter sp.]